MILFQFILSYFVDILKIGGPYARLAFLNASTVSKEKRTNLFESTVN
jgi:hypothetical protein